MLFVFFLVNYLVFLWGNIGDGRSKHIAAKLKVIQWWVSYGGRLNRGDIIEYGNWHRASAGDVDPVSEK